LPRGGATPLFDAFALAMQMLARRSEPDVWPVIVLFSDGEDTASRATFPDTLKNVLLSGTQIYAIDVEPPGERSNGSAMLQRLAYDSGGLYVQSGQGSAKIIGDLVEDLHSAQVVTYVLPGSGSEFHSVHVLPTRNLNLRFRSRRGYYSSSFRGAP
jgi:Mg-chelatase subunit ChlD